MLFFVRRSGPEHAHLLTFKEWLLPCNVASCAEARFLGFHATRQLPCLEMLVPSRQSFSFLATCVVMYVVTYPSTTKISLLYEKCAVDAMVSDEKTFLHINVLPRILSVGLL